MEANETHEDRLASVIFISLPEEFRGRFGELEIDPAKLLPVETGTTEESTWNPQDISWESIVSGMLKILAYKPEHEDAAYYRSFIRLAKPELSRELTEAGIAKARNHDYELAEEIFRALIGLEPANSRFLINLALLFEERAGVYRNTGNIAQQERCEEEAFLWYRRALSLDEVVPEAHLYAGHFHLRQNNFEQAHQQLSAYLQAGDDEEQKKRIREILANIEGQNLSDNLFKEAYDFIRLGKEEEGIAKIREFIAVHSEVWNAWFILGWGLRRTGQFKVAREAFANAIKFGGTGSDVWNEYAICQMELGEFDDSRKSLEKALQDEPENVKIISNLGILALKQGMPEEAEAFFRTVLEFEPEDSIARQYLEHLNTQQ